MKRKALVIASILILIFNLAGCNQSVKTKEAKPNVYITAEIAEGLPVKESQYKIVSDFLNVFYTFDFQNDKQTYLNQNKQLVTAKLYEFVQRDILLDYAEEKMSVLTALKIVGYEEISPASARVRVDMFYKGTSTNGFSLEETKADHLQGYVEIVKNDDKWLIDNLDIQNLSI